MRITGLMLGLAVLMVWLSATATSAEAPDETEGTEDRRRFTTFRQMLQGMPAEIGPSVQDGWDRYTMPLAREWLEERLVGATVDLNVKVTVERVQRVADGWRVVLSIADDGLNFRGSHIRPVFHGRSAEPLTTRLVVSGDERLARWADRWPDGRRMRVRAKIDQIRLGRRLGGEKKYSVGLTLVEYQFPSLEAYSRQASDSENEDS